MGARAGGRAMTVRAVLSFEEIEDGVKISLDAFRERLLLVGHYDAPRLLMECVSARVIEASTVTATIGAIWAAIRFPDRALERDQWRHLFGVAGYTIDGQAAQRPVEAIRVYRGSVSARRSDWSWTDSKRIATEFARGSYRTPPGSLWTTLAPAGNILCRNTGRTESEYVIDTEGLDIQLVAESVSPSRKPTASKATRYSLAPPWLPCANGGVRSRG